MAGIGAPELLIIFAAIMLLFGAAKLPEFARSLGRSARILKAETKGLAEGPAETDDPPVRPRRALPGAPEDRPPTGWS